MRVPQVTAGRPLGQEPAAVGAGRGTGATGTSRWRRVLRGRAAGDTGAAALEYTGLLVVVGLVVLAVTLAFTASSTRIGAAAASAVCRIVTAGQGDCGGSLPDGEARQPDAPCLVGTDGRHVSVGGSIAVIGLSYQRDLTIEELSNGQYRVSRSSGSSGGLTAGVGANVTATVGDRSVGYGASANVHAHLASTGGEVWVVDSLEEVERIKNAESWARRDAFTGGPLARWGRSLVGLGDQFPEPDSVFIASGTQVGADAHAGYGYATAQANASASAMLGVQMDRDGTATVYFETVAEVDASAEVTGPRADDGRHGAALSGQTRWVTAITVGPDDEVVSVSRSSLSTGSSAGLTNLLFGGEYTTDLADSVSTGIQWEATLPVRTDADRAAVRDLLLASGIPPVDLGPEAPDWVPSGYPGQAFMEAVRDRGDLTRHDVVLDESVALGASVDVGLGVTVGFDGEHSSSSAVTSNHQYWDGRGFSDRTNC